MLLSLKLTKLNSFMMAFDMNLLVRRWLSQGHLCLILAAVLSSVGTVWAGPLGLVRIDSHAEATKATAILGRAFVRVDNQFLVAPDATQQLLIAAAGLEFETIMEHVDPENVYQVLNLDRRQAQPVIELEKFGQVIDLEYGTRLMTLTRAEAASVSDAPGLCAVKLTDRDIPISYSAPAVAVPLADDYPSDSLAVRISQDSLYSYVQRLENFRTRYTYTDSCLAARDWIAEKFRDWGYTDVTYQSFYYSGGWHYNVVVVKPGVVEPDKVIVIGGHYDTYVDANQVPGRYLYAPGADDDGSGVALTMEIARVLEDVSLRKTIIFIPFAAEEIGLVGSEVASAFFASNNTKLEVMYNFDMVANVENSLLDLDFSSGANTVYRDFSIASARRVSSLLPVVAGMGGSSDHYPFYQNGFAVVDHIESDFSPNWHHNSDVITEMNFSYLVEVTKLAVASLAVVADAAYPATLDGIVDLGDGQSLEVSWSECSPDCEYTVYWGSQSRQYTDSVSVPAGNCNYVITGLVEADSTHILVIGESPNGYRALQGIEGAGLPLLYPRVPEDFAGTAVAAELKLNLSWTGNLEADFSHYNLYRRFGTAGSWNLYRQNVTDTTFVDTDVSGHISYEYAITAVDRDGHESGMSDGVMLYPATFDGGLVVCDAFVQDHTYDPDQAEQEAWLDSVLGGIGFGLAFSDEHGGPLTLSDIGQYGTLIWCDDDVIEKDIALSSAALGEFASQSTNMLISGYRTWFGWSPKTVPTSHLLYREFGLSYYDYAAYYDFVGGFGQNGWPSVQIDPVGGVDQWKNIPKLTPRPGAQVIMTFDSYTNMPDWEGQPVGLAYETAHGKRVLLSFPLYYLTPASEQALMAKVMEYFEFSSEFAKGDLDHTGTVDIVDVVILLDHLFISMQPLRYPELAEIDNRPGISIGDVYVLIVYLLLGGPAPVPAN